MIGGANLAEQIDNHGVLRAAEIRNVEYAQLRDTLYTAYAALKASRVAKRAREEEVAAVLETDRFDAGVKRRDALLQRVPELVDTIQNISASPSFRPDDTFSNWAVPVQTEVPRMVANLRNTGAAGKAILEQVRQEWEQTNAMPKPVGVPEGYTQEKKNYKKNRSACL